MYKYSTVQYSTVQYGTDLLTYKQVHTGISALYLEAFTFRMSKKYIKNKFNKTRGQNY